MPFFTNYSYNLIITGPYLTKSLLLPVAKNAKRLRRLYKQLKRDVEFINQTIEKYYDKKYEDVLP